MVNPIGAAITAAFAAHNASFGFFSTYSTLPAGKRNEPITVVETQSGTVTGKFTLPPITSGAQGGIEVIEKEYTECVFASGANVKGVKVGFVGY